VLNFCVVLTVAVAWRPFAGAGVGHAIPSELLRLRRLGRSSAHDATCCSKAEHF